MTAVSNLLYNLVRRDLTVRYKSTVLGFFWSFVKPLTLAGIFYIAFGQVLFGRMQLPEPRVPFALHILSGILVWTFFSGATSEAINVILANANLIKKIRLPLGVFPLATTCSHFIHFLLALLALTFLLVIARLIPTFWIFLLPFVMILHFMLTLACVLMLSSLNVFYRDTASLWEVVSMAWFYATPIVYPVGTALTHLEAVGPWKWLYLANPLTAIVLAYRRILLYTPLSTPVTLEIPDRVLCQSIGLSLITILVLLAMSWMIFKHYSKSFADEL